MKGKLWGGGFSKPTDPRFERFSQSFDDDWRLAAADVYGSIAHARMLARVKIITRAEGAKLVSGLKRVQEHLLDVILTADEDCEDVHTAVHRALKRRVGKVADKVFRIGHLGDFNDLMLAGTLSGVEMGLSLAGIPVKKGGIAVALAYLEDARTEG